MNVPRAVFAAKTATVLRSSAAWHRELTRNSRLDPEVLDRLQARRAIEHARFAMQSTPFYRDLYTAAGFRLTDLEDPGAFAELPMIDKEQLREHGDELRSTEARPPHFAVSATGGSTGQPLTLLRDLRVPARALEWRLFDWWGVHPYDDIALLYRRVKSDKETSRHRLQWWPSKRFQLDAHAMTDAAVDAFFETWRRVRPSFFIGYVGGIAELADKVEDRGLTIPSPRAIGVTAAPLSEGQRTKIERAFGAPVYDHYRSAEIPWMGGECRAQNGLHVFSDVRKLELIDEHGSAVPNGTSGETVWTDLTNRVFPIIRYRLGDRTSWLEGLCECGVTLPRIASITGRKSEVLRLPSGRSIPGEGIAQIFSKTPTAVRQFQVHQLADYSIIVRCVLGTASDARSTVDAVIEQVRQVVGGEVPVSADLVDHIPHDGGKIRYMKSDLR